ncbi:MAG TPA: UDP-N-acetylglucosamine 1-carboxyvinyltransferase [Nitriliruptorales bacterium]|nr:UDP-N-acetylglucosamine 1-carboxyvinyltransferase [Nitriliruptorales bacterium]
MVTRPAPGPVPADALVVRGGGRLQGTIHVNGAKNSALKLMAAALLAEGETVVENVPAIADVPIMGEVLTGLGAKVDVDSDGTVTIVVGELDWHAPREFVAQIRASVVVLGPLVARLGRARIVPPGGDQIGARRIDMHLQGLEAMGARVAQDGDELDVRVPRGRLQGANVTLDFPSVGATENLLMAAVLADGQTIIDNAAREPEIQDLCGMLIAMGAHIHGVGTSILTVEGVEGLQPVVHDTIPDRIEAGTFAFAAALTRGDLLIRHARPGHLKLPLAKLAATGADVVETRQGLRVRGPEHLRAVDVVTLPYPGFPTDLQPQLMVLLSQAHGTGIITENVFESRFTFVHELTELGAEIAIDGHHAIIRGPRRLRGTQVRSLDVRAGAACLLAGLVAEGETRITGVHHIDRGYASIAERLQAVGADIERVVA